MTTATSRTDTRDPDRIGPNTVNLPAELAALEAMDAGALCALWRRLRRDPPPRLSRDLMRRILAYDLQARVHGGLSTATARRLARLADALKANQGAGLVAAARQLKPGARLVREWQGRTHTVLVQDDGYAYDGRVFRSLSQIARTITGVRWSGPRFFGLARATPPCAPKAD